MYKDPTQWASPLGYSAVGHLHSSSGELCQDFFSIKSTDTGWFAIVVCDGAGSAKKGGRGAEIFSERFSDALIEISKKIDSSSPGSWINDAIVESILKIRNEVRLMSCSNDIRDYHCTLLAILLSKEGGFSVHIGDGVIFGGILEERNDNSVLIDSKYFLSRPENGEYLNETYFVTESIWTKHLRISPLPFLDWVCLVSDGGASLCLESDCRVNEHFLPTIFNNLIKNNLQETNIIANEIGREKYRRSTTDDKTIVIIYRNKISEDKYKDAVFKTSFALNLEPKIFGEKIEKFKDKTDVVLNALQKEKSIDDLLLIPSNQKSSNKKNYVYFAISFALVSSILLLGLVIKKHTNDIQISSDVKDKASVTESRNTCRIFDELSDNYKTNWHLNKYQICDLSRRQSATFNSKGVASGL